MARTGGGLRVPGEKDRDVRELERERTELGAVEAATARDQMFVLEVRRQREASSRARVLARHRAHVAVTQDRPRHQLVELQARYVERRPEYEIELIRSQAPDAGLDEFRKL